MMGVYKEDLPTLRAAVPAPGIVKKYKSPMRPSDFTVENIGQFIDDVNAGVLDSYLKSEEPPETNDGLVKIVVGKTWDEIVMDPTKDVFVKFYSPTCKHSKKLAPVWEELASSYADHPNLVIASFDATMNEHVEGVYIKEYPTFIFYPEHNKKGITYDMDRNINAFHKWLRDKSEILNYFKDDL